MSRSFKVDGIQMSLWGAAWWIRMQNVGAWRMLRECSTACHHITLGCGHLQRHDIGTREMCVRAERTGTVSTNATV